MSPSRRFPFRFNSGNWPMRCYSFLAAPLSRIALRTRHVFVAANRTVQ